MNTEEDSAFPPPPIYYKEYHPRNPNPPPPPEPFDGKEYRFFGGVFRTFAEKFPTLGSLNNLKELFPRKNDPDTETPKKELSIDETIDSLKLINSSILRNFLELVKILKDKPCAEMSDTKETSVFDDIEKIDSAHILTYKPAWELKVSQIRLIITNVYFLLNSLRDIQGKMQIRDTLNSQLQKKIQLRKKYELMIAETKKIFTQKLDDVKNFRSSKIFRRKRNSAKMKDEETEGEEIQDQEEDDDDDEDDDEVFLGSSAVRDRTEGSTSQDVVISNINDISSFESILKFYPEAKKYNHGYFLPSDDFNYQENFSRKLGDFMVDEVHRRSEVNRSSGVDQIYLPRKKKTKLMMNKIEVPVELSSLFDD